MIYLPKNIAPIGDIAGRDDTRYAMSHVKLTECQNDWWRLEATDGKTAVILQGPSNPAPLSADPQLVAAAPNGATSGLVPAQALAKALRQLEGFRGKELSLAVCLSDTVATFVRGQSSERFVLSAERFPDINSVLPKSAPLAAATVNASLLIKLLKLCASIDGEGKVTILFYKPGAPLGLVAKNAQGQTADCLLMPLTDA